MILVIPVFQDNHTDGGDSQFIIAAEVVLTAFGMHQSGIQSSICISADIFLATKYGFGMHVRDIKLEWWPGYLKVHAPTPAPTNTY